MCGRFAQTTTSEELVELFHLGSRVLVQPRFNLAPTQPVLAIRGHNDGYRAHTLRWGLVPSWAKDLKGGAKMINARSETVFEKRSFSHAARHQRCVIPATGFYEWRDTPAGKMPTLFTPATGAVFRFAGLWSSWADDDGAVFYTTTILTTEANQTMAPFHHRMPVFLTTDGSNTWLDPTLSDPEQLQPLLTTAPPESIKLRAVSKRVNNVRNDNPQCWENATSQGLYSPPL
jgi:putative SOS response-associated peptidase YedK